MQDDKIRSQLVERARALLQEGKVQRVVGWRRGLFDSDVTPGIFSTVADLEANFVHNQWCAANLSKYLVRLTREIEIKKSTVRTGNKMAKQRDPNAEDKSIPQEKLLVFLKPCDTYSFTQLLKESRITRDDVYVIGIPCDGMADPDTGDLSERCFMCKSKKHITYDELIGEEGEVLQSHRFDEVEKIEKMTAAERFQFWRGELSRCIRCNACRDVCPACTCEKCVFSNNKMYTSQKVAQDPFEENLFHIIRAWHVAGRCTDCGECSRVCPQNIPLHLLNRKLIHDMNRLYGAYIAGQDMDSKPPMLTYSKEDAEVAEAREVMA